MTDRDCPNCIWHSEHGCTSWNCDMVTRREARARLQWKSVEHALPDTERYVLCVTRTAKGAQNIIRGYYSDGAWRCGMNSNVTHWMELPPLPEVNA